MLPSRYILQLAILGEKVSVSVSAAVKRFAAEREEFLSTERTSFVLSFSFFLLLFFSFFLPFFLSFYLSLFLSFFTSCLLACLLACFCSHQWASFFEAQRRVDQKIANNTGSSILNGKFYYAFPQWCQQGKIWNNFFQKEIYLLFFVLKFHKSRSNSLSSTKIWRNSLFSPKMQIFYCCVVTLILWIALISKRFELQMWDWS